MLECCSHLLLTQVPLLVCGHLFYHTMLYNCAICYGISVCPHNLVAVVYSVQLHLLAYVWRLRNRLYKT